MPVVGGVLSGVKELLNDTGVTPLLGNLLEKTDNDNADVSGKGAETEPGINDTKQIGNEGDVSLNDPVGV